MNILLVLCHGTGNVIQTIPAYLNLENLVGEENIKVVYQLIYPTDSVKACGIYPRKDIEEVDGKWVMKEQYNYDYMVKSNIGLYVSTNGFFNKECIDTFSEMDSEVRRNLKAISVIPDCKTEMLKDWYEKEPKQMIKGDYITIHNGGLNVPEWEMKKYPMFGRLIEMLKDEYDYKIVSIGSKEEYIKGTVNRTGLHLKESTYLIRNSKLHISTDTSTMHIAGLVDAKAIGIITCTSKTKNTDHDFHNKLITVESDCECSPCQKGYHWHPRSTECRQFRKSFPCQNIEPEKIFKKIKKINLTKHK